MKLFLLLVFLAGGLCLASAEDYVWGARDSNDQLLESRSIVFSWEGSWQQHNIRFPIEGEYTQSITCITILEQLENHGQTVDIAEGGIGQHSVRILFYSPAFRGIEDLVKIYGSN